MLSIVRSLYGSLRRLPVHRVKVLAAGVAEQERGIVGCKGESAAVAADGHDGFQIGNLFCLVIADPNADHGIFSFEIQNVYVLAVVRPVQPPPRSEIISYWPSFVPEVRAIGCAILSS